MKNWSHIGEPQGRVRAKIMCSAVSLASRRDAQAVDTAVTAADNEDDDDDDADDADDDDDDDDDVAESSGADAATAAESALTSASNSSIFDRIHSAARSGSPWATLSARWHTGRSKPIFSTAWYLANNVTNIQCGKRWHSHWSSENMGAAMAAGWAVAAEEAFVLLLLLLLLLLPLLLPPPPLLLLLLLLCGNKEKTVSTACCTHCKRTSIPTATLSLADPSSCWHASA